jgi:hypothetical protein
MPRFLLAASAAGLRRRRLQRRRWTRRPAGRQRACYAAARDSTQAAALLLLAPPAARPAARALPQEQHTRAPRQPTASRQSRRPLKGAHSAVTVLAPQSGRQGPCGARRARGPFLVSSPGPRAAAPARGGYEPPPAGPLRHDMHVQRRTFVSTAGRASVVWLRPTAHARWRRRRTCPPPSPPRAAGLLAAKAPPHGVLVKLMAADPASGRSRRQAAAPHPAAAPGSPLCRRQLSCALVRHSRACGDRAATACRAESREQHPARTVR